MELIRMNEIAKIKQEVKLRQWAEMIQQRKESGLTVSQWCTENGVNIKTYYYRLQKVRQAMCKETECHDIVPVCEPEEEKINSKISKTVWNNQKTINFENLILKVK